MALCVASGISPGSWVCVASGFHYGPWLGLEPLFWSMAFYHGPRLLGLLAFYKGPCSAGLLHEPLAHVVFYPWHICLVVLLPGLLWLRAWFLGCWPFLWPLAKVAASFYYSPCGLVAASLGCDLWCIGHQPGCGG
ncbi:unnamed protein product [Protopolystoma xenopodis]|uniref:Uncharacterized protein n=1 Tax=Protopolystoma xenopodis TaxID=117903 RepID=A0A3S5FF96_9PLAT|nr:unnamed protein product [Protopolystoma xenopodis]